MRAQRFHGFLLALGASAAILLSTSVQAAHSRRRLSRPEGGGGRHRYDREITKFTEDGRLLQVAYGVEASLRGSTMASIKTKDGICWVVPQSSFGKVHRIDDHLWLLTAGLSGDARVLARFLKGKCQAHRLQYGEAPRTKQMAEAAGQVQHELTYTAGARPLGCTAMVLGIDPSFDEKQLGKPCMYQTDPGGVVQECVSYYADDDNDSSCKQAAVGGKDGNQIARILPDLLKGRMYDRNSRSWWFLKKKGKKKNDKTGAKNETEEDDDSKGTDEEPTMPGELSKLAAKLAEEVLNLEDQHKTLDSDSTLPTVDVWIIRPDTKRRGGQHAVCYQNVRKDSLDQITDPR